MKTLASVTLLAALLAVGTADARAKKPPAWMWTTATAARQAVSLDIWPAEGTLTAIRCQGKGKRIARRYGTFRCSATLQPTRLSEPDQRVGFWVKVRRNGTGQPCASTTTLAKIPKGCLNPKGARAEGTGDDAVAQTQAKIGGPGGLYQGPVGCLGYGAGFWRCWIGTGEDTLTSGHSVVVFFKAGPKVTILNMPAG